MATFGERLKELRNSRKFTQKELARILNLSESAISMYERDEREPSFETMKSLSELFDVTRAYLLGDTDDPKGSSTQPSLIEDIPEDLRELFMDPELQIAFRDIPGTPEEVKEEIIELLSFIKKREKNRKPGDKQGE